MFNKELQNVLNGVGKLHFARKNITGRCFTFVNVRLFTKLKTPNEIMSPSCAQLIQKIIVILRKWRI